jgi:hypothetical protein
MLKTGSGFFAMWNGIAPEAAAEFPLMHARDHIGEHLSYLGPGGIQWARRFGTGQGNLPPYFAMYAMPTLEALVDPQFADAQVCQTSWFLAIRPHYRDRIAHHCRVLASSGGGVGSAAATFHLHLGPEAKTDCALLDEAMDSLTRLAPITAAHLGVPDWTVPHRVGLPLPDFDAADAELGVLVVESFDRFELVRALDDIAEYLSIRGIAMKVRAYAHYSLSYALDQADLQHLRHFRRDDALVTSSRLK